MKGVALWGLLAVYFLAGMTVGVWLAVAVQP